MDKQSKTAILSAFAAFTLDQQAKGEAAKVSEFMLDLGKKAKTVEQFIASAEKVETWLRSKEGMEALKKSGYKYETSKAGVVLMPPAWKQAKSDVKATFTYGVDLNATTKDRKTGKTVPVVTSLKVARKLKTAARDAQVNGDTDDGSTDTDNHKALRKELQALLVLANDLTEGEAAALTAQLVKLREQFAKAPGKAQTAKGEGKQANVH